MNKHLLKFLTEQLNLDNKNAVEFSRHFQIKKLNKGDYFLRNGNYCNEIAFINTGAMYCVYNKNGIAKIDEFSFENEFITDYRNILLKKPSDKDIICLEDCELSIVHTQILENTLVKNPAFERIGRLIAEGLFINYNLKAKSLFLDDAETRYLNLLSQKPNLPQRVPQYLVASYLNISPETLSRIRRKISKR